jgi:hypothetical protein
MNIDVALRKIRLCSNGTVVSETELSNLGIKYRGLRRARR